MSEIKKVNLAKKFDQINEAWDPRIIGALNGQHVKIAKFQGEFIHHSHPNEDELFLVIKGTISIELEDNTIELKEGEMTIIPKGIEHRPLAHEEAHVLMFEPAGTLNTGNQTNEKTREDLEWI